MVWGVDLVEQQLRIAAGEPLPFTQADLAPRGHAIEARVYAEDPANGFLPTGGTIHLLHEATDRPHVRVDSSMLAGGTVGSDYDPMLAKVMAWGDDRDSARRRLDQALADTAVLGLTTNIEFLRVLLTDADVAAGNLDTGLIDRLVADRPAAVMPPEVAVAASIAELHARPEAGPWGDRNGWRIGEHADVCMRHIHPGGSLAETRLRRVGDGQWHATVGEWTATVAATQQGHTVTLVVDGTTQVFTVVAEPSVGTWVGRGGSTWHLAAAPNHGSRRDATAAAGLTVTSPMPGTVVSIDVAVGQRVEAGQTVAVVEAMKMEHTLRAAQDAIVREVLAAAGDRVALHQRLVSLDAADA